MKKEKLITRTIVSTKANLKLFDITNSIVIDVPDFIFTGELTEKDIEKQFNLLNRNDVKLIMVNSFEKVEKLYGVTESDFMKIAIELPPRKVNNAQEDE